MNYLKDINEYIHSLKNSSRLGDQVVFHKVLSQSDPVFSDTEQKFSDEIENALSSSGINSFYEHQAKALDLARAGKHVVVATPTASGKTLVYNLSVMEKILEDEKSKALYIYPLKALAQDQLGAFLNITKRLRTFSPSAAIYDGDTTSWTRKKIRDKLPNVILTNPEMLHLSFLPYHNKWAQFLSELKIIVVDEVHIYRGVMGSHMAQVFRRLNRICRFYGSSPTYIFCSATISNPAELAGQLTGLYVEQVSKSGAPLGNRHILFIDPIEGAAQAAIQLLRAALHRQLRTIVYTQSRKLTELIAMWAQNRSGNFRDRISAYRAGFLPEERRAIESRMSNGDLLAVISTSALELGIDIGDLDLCILVGYPGTVISTIQRGGRVGRSGQDSALVLIAGEDALDKYFMRHPEDLFQREPESAVINPYNQNILSRHLVCAAAELPLVEGEAYIKEAPVHRVISLLEEKGELLKSGAGDNWHSNVKIPHSKVDLRGSGDKFSIIDNATNTAIGEIDAFRAFKETHPGAIYLHMGNTYLVNTLDLGTRVARVSSIKADYYTRVAANKETEILEIFEEKRLWNASFFTGHVKVTEQVSGYEKWSIHTQKRLDRINLDLPPLIFETDSLWFIIPNEIQRAVEDKYLHFMGGIHAIEHAAIGIFPLLVLTDRNDLGGISTTLHPQIKGPAVFIYDSTAGGAGLSRQAFIRADLLLDYTFKVISECPCETGCPSCVHSPKCGSGNRPIDKSAASFILSKLMTGSDFKHDDISLTQSVIPGLTRNPDFSWIPAYAGMTRHVLTNVVVYKQKKEKPRKKTAKLRRSSRRRKGSSDFKETVIDKYSADSVDKAIHFCILDIETQLSAEEVGGWHKADLMRISCAVIYDSEKDEYIEFLEDQMPQLVNFLKQSDLVVGFNIKRFDYRVLSGYTDFNFNNIKTLDILEHVHTRLGYRLSLDHLARETLGVEKKADGLQALKWWKQGRISDIIDYCRKDVEITKELFKFGRANGYLLFNNKAGSKVRIPVDWQNI